MSWGARCLDAVHGDFKGPPARRPLVISLYVPIQPIIPLYSIYLLFPILSTPTRRPSTRATRSSRDNTM